MRRSLVIACWLLWFLLAGALPAYANNPPAPDGMFGLILIFPVVIAAWRFAGVQANAKERKWRVANGVLLTLCVLFSGAGSAGGVVLLLGLLYILVYGIRRGIQVAQRGQGKKRLALGGAIVLFTFSALINYLASTMHYPYTAEPEAVGALRTIATAEETIRSIATLDQNKNHVGEFGTLDQLIQTGVLQRDDLTRGRHGNYRFVVVVSGDPARDEKEFFAYASPVKYSSSESGVWYFVPGGSLVAALHPRPAIARRTFATDESGVIRQADLGVARPVTREEARKWEPLR
jgi:hypothetical protein